jgi:hypothetical protein
VEEPEFWRLLEYRLCSEFHGSPDSDTRFLWCDGLDPSGTVEDKDGTWIEGVAWICGDARREGEFRFRLRIGSIGSSAPRGDWSRLLPRDDMTGWLLVDRSARRIEMRPEQAIADDDAEAPG